MDKFKQFGKSLRKDKDEAAQNTRRVQQNFPLVERKVDILSGNQSYHLEFPITAHKHTVTVNMKFKPDNCCECDPGAQIEGREVIAFWKPPSFASGVADETTNSATFVEPLLQTGTNFNYGYASPFFYHQYQEFPFFGGYTIGASGIVIPIDGVYSVLFEVRPQIDTDQDSYIIPAITQNGETISKKVHSVENNRLTIQPPHNIELFQYAACVPLHKNDQLNVTIQAKLPLLVIPGAISGPSGSIFDSFNSVRVSLLGAGYGTLIGYVFDNDTHAPLEGATVSYVLGFGGSTLTDEFGSYEFDFLRPATYSVTATMTGYSPMTRDIEVFFDEISQIDFNLTHL